MSQIHIHQFCSDAIKTEREREPAIPYFSCYSRHTFCNIRCSHTMCTNTFTVWILFVLNLTFTKSLKTFLYSEGGGSGEGRNLAKVCVCMCCVWVCVCVCECVLCVCVCVCMCCVCVWVCVCVCMCVCMYVLCVWCVCVVCMCVCVCMCCVVCVCVCVCVCVKLSRVAEVSGRGLLATALNLVELYRVIRNDCRGFNSLSCIMHLR